jgi:hypothetical protein
MGFFDRFFGDDDAGNESTNLPEEDTDVTIDLSGDDVTIEGADATSDVEVTDGDPTGFVDALDSGAWFATHDIPVSRSDSDDSDGTSGSAPNTTTEPSSRSSEPGGHEGAVATGPATGPTAADVTTPPTTDPDVDADTILFPTDPAVLQSLEIRAKNGAHDRVETSYVLTGEHGRPLQDLWAVDDPSFYPEASATHLQSLGQQIAHHVAAGVEDPPGRIVRIHTHPPVDEPNKQPSTLPSQTDRENADRIVDQFADAFDVSPSESHVSHGIHAFYHLDTGTSPKQPRSANASDNGLTWRGEQYRHELALYDENFRPERTVKLVGPSDHPKGDQHGT